MVERAAMHDADHPRCGAYGERPLLAHCHVGELTSRHELRWVGNILISWLLCQLRLQSRGHAEHDDQTILAAYVGCTRCGTILLIEHLVASFRRKCILHAE